MNELKYFTSDANVIGRTAYLEELMDHSMRLIQECRSAATANGTTKRYAKRCSWDMPCYYCRKCYALDESTIKNPMFSGYIAFLQNK